jgi:hypothetical protein
MYQIYQITISFALFVAVVGWFLIKWIEQKNNKVNKLFYPFTIFRLQILYEITAAGFFYFGIGCFVLLMQQ